MKLTKENIQTIDTYLTKKGISYWDIRLEMTDHIACKMESKKGTYDFESLFNHTVRELGWENDLKGFENRRLKTINKTIRKKYFGIILGYFTRLKSLVLVVLSIFAFYLIVQNVSFKTFKIFSFLLFGIPIIYFTLHYAYTSIKIKKSGYMLYGYFYVVFFMLMSNLFYQWPRPGGFIEVSELTRQNIIFFTTIFNVLFICSGIKVYLETYKQYNEVYKRLNSD
jgi:hypothetical protein